ncbi:proton-translocating NAD(P)(+) transhydrogenase [Entamoeba marina]
MVAEPVFIGMSYIFTCLMNIRNISLFLAPILLGVVVGTFISFRVKSEQFPMFVCIFNCLVSLACLMIFIGEFLSPLYFGDSTKDSQEMYLLLVQVCLGIVLSNFSFTGNIALVLKTLNVLPPQKPFVYFRCFSIASTCVLSVIVSIIIVIYNDPLFQEILLFILVCLTSTFSFESMLIDKSDLPIAISILQCAEGWSVVIIGFVRFNNLIVFCGSIIGMYCLISILDLRQSKNVDLFSAFCCNETKHKKDIELIQEVKEIDVNSVGELCIAANRILIIPSHELMSQQTQILLSDVIQLLESNGKNIKIGIHPCIEALKGLLEVLLIAGNINKESIGGFELNKEMKNFDLCMVLGECKTTTLSSSHWKKFDVHNSLNTVVISESQQIEQNDSDAFWYSTSVNDGLQNIVEYLRHMVHS